MTWVKTVAFIHFFFFFSVLQASLLVYSLLFLLRSKMGHSKLNICLLLIVAGTAAVLGSPAKQEPPQMSQKSQVKKLINKKPERKKERKKKKMEYSYLTSLLYHILSAHPEFRLGLKFRNHRACRAWMGARLPFRNTYHKGFSLFMGQTRYYAPDENSGLF